MGSLPTFYSVLAPSMYLAEYLTSYKLIMSPKCMLNPSPSVIVFALGDE